MIKHIIIVGGGSAGWITAAVLAARHRTDSPEAIKISLIESPEVSTIGVGEGSWPSLVNTLRKVGISENEFIRHCDVSFKQGIQFEGWVTGESDDVYFHPFSNPTGPNHLNLAPHWQREFTKNRQSTVSFAEAVTPQVALCLEQKGPRKASDPEFQSYENYGYHLDAGKFSKFLQQHCVNKLGVTHIQDHVENVITSETGDIQSLVCRARGELVGDFFIDCSGLQGLLIDKVLNVPYISKNDILFADTALAVQVNYSNQEDPVYSMTRAVAQTNGWIWDIGLPTRRGVGHVYSSKHIDDDLALRELRDYLKRSGFKDEITPRKISFTPGHREKFWVKNCVAVGMSSGFLEPLEAAALGMIELSARMIAEHLPVTRDAMDIVANNYNEKFTLRWQLIIDFLKLHYVLSKRRDSEFWKDNVDPATSTQSLQDLLLLWQSQGPCNNGFLSPYDMFPVCSYQYVLYGMGFKTLSSHLNSSKAESDFARKIFQQVKQTATKHRQMLPANRELLNQLNKG